MVNYRPEYQHQWGDKPYYTHLRLDPLGKESAEEMLAALLGSGLPLPDQGEGRGVGIAVLKRLIIERTQGNPFFMEEMVQALFEQGVLVRNGVVKLAKPLGDIRVPATVQALLASRIDRLPAAEEELLQGLAVLGREFSSDVVRLLVGKPDDELERMLSDLQLVEFIYEQPALPDIKYTFKHALTQEVAYNSVLIERRRLLHERAAQSIEALHAGRLEDHLGELAHHYDRGGNAPKAVEYLGRAGVRAAALVAHSEAIGFLTRALELLKQLPDNAERMRIELDLQIALGFSLLVTRGPAAPEREPVLLRAQQLCEQLGDDARLAEMLVLLATFRMAVHQLGPARELLERVLALAPTREASATLAEAHFALGIVLQMFGEFAAARQHLERALDHSGPWLGYSGIQGALAQGVLANIMLFLGFPAGAIANSRAALAAARRLGDPLSIAQALVASTVFHGALCDANTQMAQSGELLSIATEHGLAFHAAHAAFTRAKVLAVSGRGEKGIAELQHAVSELRAIGGAPISALCQVLAEAYGANGRVEEGLRAVAEGIAYAEGSGERVSESELYRVEGELFEVQDPSNEAEAEQCFRTAIDVARRQSARLFELRATASLARLLKRQGKIDEARAMLAEIYGWFTEGFDIADLKDAAELLRELGA